MVELFWTLLQWVCLIPVIGGSVYAVLSLFAVLRFRTGVETQLQSDSLEWPPVTILKPVCGLEKNQKMNLRSACLQDYPTYQIVYSVQKPHDPVIPLLREIQEEFGLEKVSIAIEDRQAGPNGKINNLLGGLSHARYDTLVISDSDVRLEPNYLKAIIPPLADPDVGCVCTLYRATSADRWFEKIELLTFNADFIPSVIFAHMTGSAKFCLGSSMALRRSSLKEIGGLEAFSDYLVEDYEMGKRLWTSGKKIVLVHYFINMVIDLESAFCGWSHQIHWDQKTRAANPVGFFATVLVRLVPFALLFAISRSVDAVGLMALAGAIGLRLATAAFILGWGLRDREGLRSLALLPLRDLTALGSWFFALMKKTVVWRGSKFTLTRDGRLVSGEQPS